MDASQHQPIVSRTGEVKGVIGAFYEITSGAVDFLETEEELRVASRVEHGSRWREHLL